MRTREPITIVCDGCGKTGTGARELRTLPGPQGPVALQRMHAPQGWAAITITPDIAVPPQPNVDPFAPAPELARLTGAPIDAAFCGKCRASLRRSDMRAQDAADRVEASPTAIEALPERDERKEAADAERRKRDEDAEAADRAAFEAKRATAAAGGA